MSFTAEVSDVDASGELAFLDMTATNIDGSPTQFVGGFDVTLTDPGAAPNDRLSLSEMFSGDFSNVVDHSLPAEADLALRLELSAGGVSFLPRLRADLNVDWNNGDGADANGVSKEKVQMKVGDF